MRKTGAVFPANRGERARDPFVQVIVFGSSSTIGVRVAIEHPKSATVLRAALTAALVAAFGIALAVLAGRTDSYGQVATWGDDLEQRLTARPLSFRRAVVFDIDAETTRRLQHQLGEWPYKRDIYALVTNWLWRSGANAVVFDIPLHERGTGDLAFAAALTSRAVLAAVPPPSPRERASGLPERSAGQGLQVAGIEPRLLRSTELALPRAEFTPPGGARVGVGGATPGIGGRVALLHEFHGEALPDLSLAALLAVSSWPRLSVAGDRLAAGYWRWPVTDAAEVMFRYPSNGGDLPVISFYRLALAAAGVPEYAPLAGEVRGRVVFIGRSRAAPDVHTPFGPRTGLHHAALVMEMLNQQRVSRPGSLLIDALLFALALTLPACSVARADRARGLDHFAGALGALVLPAAAGIGLFAAGQASHWPMAILAGLFAQVLGAAWWRFGIRRGAGPTARGQVAPEDAPIVIHVDPVVRHLVPKFLELCRTDAAGMRSALEAGNFDGLRKTGHKLKGSGGSYGFNDITRIGAAVEAAATSADSARLRELIDEFARYLERVRPVLD